MALPLSMLSRGLDSVFSPRPDPPGARDKAWHVAIGILWLGLALYLAAHHVLWRDEVRALSLALRGETIFDMPAQARGYGHPLFWHVILRAGHDLIGSRVVLPGAAFTIAIAATVTLIWASRLRGMLVALVVFGCFGLYEYVVVARNYGISLLLLFVIAASYCRSRGHGMTLGFLLALLCNTNVHALVLAVALYVFWAGDVILGHGANAPARKTLFWNGVLLAFGAAVSIVSVFPSVEDAPSVSDAGDAVRSLQFLPSFGFGRIFGNFHYDFSVQAIAALLVIGSLGMFAQRPAALLAGIIALSGLQAIFVLVYPGFYRHQALLIAFYITLAWLVAAGHGGRWSAGARAAGWLRRAELGGRALFLVLLAAQLPASARVIANTAGGRPEGEARRVAALIARHRLEQAIIIVEPDFMGETLRYYVDNPLYSLRQMRFADVTGMKLAESSTMTLARILAAARAVQHRHRRDVLILLNAPLSPGGQRSVIERGSFGPLLMTAADQRRFRSETVPLGELRSAIGDEEYGTYLLKPASPGN